MSPTRGGVGAPVWLVAVFVAVVVGLTHPLVVAAFLFTAVVVLAVVVTLTARRARADSHRAVAAPEVACPASVVCVACGAASVSALAVRGHLVPVCAAHRAQALTRLADDVATGGEPL